MEIFGLSLDHALLVVALILIVIDFFVPTDLPTHIGYLILAYLAGTNVPLPVLYQVLLGVFAWFAVLAFHYTLWRGFTRRIVHKFIAPTRYRSGMAGMVEGTGILREREGKRLVEVHGDLYPCEERGAIADGETVRILEARNGRLVVAAEPGE